MLDLVLHVGEHLEARRKPVGVARRHPLDPRQLLRRVRRPPRAVVLRGPVIPPLQRVQAHRRVPRSAQRLEAPDALHVRHHGVLCAVHEDEGLPVPVLAGLRPVPHPARVRDDALDVLRELAGVVEREERALAVAVQERRVDLEDLLDLLEERVEPLRILRLAHELAVAVRPVGRHDEVVGPERRLVVVREPPPPIEAGAVEDQRQPASLRGVVPLRCPPLVAQTVGRRRLVDDPTGGLRVERLRRRRAVGIRPLRGAGRASERDEHDEHGEPHDPGRSHEDLRDVSPGAADSATNGGGRPGTQPARARPPPRRSHGAYPVRKARARAPGPPMDAARERSARSLPGLASTAPPSVARGPRSSPSARRTRWAACDSDQIGRWPGAPSARRTSDPAGGAFRSR